jgi:hypothetical protein
MQIGRGKVRHLGAFSLMGKVRSFYLQRYNNILSNHLQIEGEHAMKKINLLLLTVAFAGQIAFATTWEMGIAVNSGTRVRIWRNGFYTHDAKAGSAGSQENCDYTATFYLHIGTDYTAYGLPLSPGTTYTIVISGRAVDLTTPSSGNLGDFIIVFRLDSLPRFVLHNC